MPSRPFIRVLLPLPFGTPFDYHIPERDMIKVGDYVRVPFGKRELVGVVWENVTQDLPHKNTKGILERLPFPSLPEVSKDFLQWVANYTMTPIGLILKMILNTPEAFDSPKKKDQLELGTPNLAPIKLSDDQIKATTKLSKVLDPVQHKTFLLDGVTGSGKTEVYFQAIQKVINQGKQALVLLPEISLSSQWLERFEARFGTPPLVWHSSLTKAQRRKNWRAIAKGEAKVIVGARSALFLPFPSLGLIVVDEEHDGSYKQEETIIYNVRDMAVVRGSLSHIPVVLASATPSLESLENARQGKYELIHLPSRFGQATLPHIDLIDMRAYAQRQTKQKLESKWISPPLLKALRDTLEAGEQALFFLNRRGYAPLTLCGACGERASCPYCTAWLVEHRHKGHLTCHHCGHTIQPIKICEACGKKDTIVACGPGVERVSEELTKLIPECRHRMVTSDVIHSPKAMSELITQFQNHELDVLIGTQMLAKGFHFPKLTLVGVIDADLGLSGSDLRASEKSYQLLHQVAGRAGREEKPGQVLLQTYQPEHPLFTALISHDRDKFIDQESQVRQLSHMPPFGKLVSIIVSGANTKHLEETLRTLSSRIPNIEGIDIWGPAPAPLSLLRGKYRWRYLLKAPKQTKVQSVVERWLQGLSLPHNVKIQVDVDPYSFM